MNNTKAIAHLTYRALVRNTIVALMLGCVLAIGVFTQNTVRVERPLPTGSPAYVLSQCIPANGAPVDAVVIQRVGKGAKITANPKVIDRAIADVFFGKEFKNVRVLGFCRL